MYNNQYTIPMSTTYSSQQTNKIYVNSYDDVVHYQIPYGGSFIFIDRMKPVIYEKTTDAYGGCTIKTYKIVEDTSKDDKSITKEDLQKILDRLDALETNKTSIATKEETPNESFV